MRVSPVSASTRQHGDDTPASSTPCGQLPPSLWTTSVESSNAAAPRIGPGATTAPQHVDAQVVGVPALTTSRVGGHADFDRVVLDLDGELPGFGVRYVPQVVRDGSGEPVVLRGARVPRGERVPLEHVRRHHLR
jgi:hypothetical protein